MNTLLELLEQDCTQSPAQLAAQAGMTEAEAKDELRRLEEEGVILGYQAVIDWDRVKRENVTALIEVKVTPQSLAGFDRIAERIYQYDEVESMYLMSGSFDLTVIISGRSLREVAQFVGERLAPLEGVTGTATHFILKKYKEKADKFGASKVIAFATSATRDSQNREEFLSQVRDIGIDIRCIAGEREAQLNFLGNSIVFKDRILVLDIGGGSTEFTLGENGNIEFTKSINIGAVRGTERFFPEQNYTEENIEECRNWIKEMVSGVKFLKDDNFTLVGVAGTATTQISVQKQMEIYDSSEVHLSKINLDELRKNLQLFLSCDGEKRKEIVGLEAKRADVIIAGTIILIAIMEELGVDSMVVSESDNLNGAMISKEI